MNRLWEACSACKKEQRDGMQDAMRYLCTGRKKEKKKERIRQDSNRITIFQEVGALQTRLTCSSTKQVTAEHSLASVLSY